MLHFLVRQNHKSAREKELHISVLRLLLLLQKRLTSAEDAGDGHCLYDLQLVGYFKIPIDMKQMRHALRGNFLEIKAALEVLNFNGDKGILYDILSVADRLWAPESKAHGNASEDVSILKDSLGSDSLFKDMLENILQQKNEGSDSDTAESTEDGRFNVALNDTLRRLRQNAHAALKTLLEEFKSDLSDGQSDEEVTYARI